MANQMTMTFNVENQILSRTDTNKIIEKSKNYLFAEFTFSADWNNTNKTIIFENKELRYKIYLDSNNKCQVPNRIIRNDGFTISVIGENSENFVTITTNELYIGVGKSNATDEEMESIYEITSQSLDVNKNGGTCNLEYKKYLHSTVLNCTGYFNGTIYINIVIDKKEAFTDYRDLLQYISDYRLSTGFKMYVDSMGTVFDVFTEFLYDKTDESQEIDFTGYGVDEDNLVLHVNDRVIQLDMVTMSAYTPQEIQ